MLFINSTEQKHHLYVRDLISNQNKLLSNNGHWKASPIWLTNESWLYILYRKGKSEIVLQQENNTTRTIYESSQFIKKLAVHPKKENIILFNHFINNDNAVLKIIKYIKRKSFELNRKLFKLTANY